MASGACGRVEFIVLGLDHVSGICGKSFPRIYLASLRDRLMHFLPVRRGLGMAHMLCRNRLLAPQKSGFCLPLPERCTESKHINREGLRSTSISQMGCVTKRHAISSGSRMICSRPTLTGDDDSGDCWWRPSRSHQSRFSDRLLSCLRSELCCTQLEVGPCYLATLQNFQVTARCRQWLRA